MKLGTYSKIVSLDRGALFGEMALNDPNALRKATIITNADCHFAVLNKKIFNNSIKIGAQRHMKDTLQFFIEIPIFNGIPESVFYNKYYTNLSKNTIVKGKNVINQGEKPDHVTLLQTGSYGLTTRMSLYDLTRLILHYADVLIYQSINNHEINRNNKNASDKTVQPPNTAIRIFSYFFISSAPFSLQPFPCFYPSDDVEHLPEHAEREHGDNNEHKPHNHKRALKGFPSVAHRPQECEACLHAVNGVSKQQQKWDKRAEEGHRVAH